MATEAIDKLREGVKGGIESKLRGNWHAITKELPAGTPDQQNAYFKQAAQDLYDGKPLKLPSGAILDFKKLPQKMKDEGLGGMADAVAGTFHVPGESDVQEVNAAIERGSDKSSENWFQKIMDYVIGFVIGIGRMLAGGGFGSIMSSIAERRAASAIPYIDKELDELAQKRPHLAQMLNDPEARQGIHQGVFAYAHKEATGVELPVAGPRPQDTPLGGAVPANAGALESQVRAAIHQKLHGLDASGKRDPRIPDSEVPASQLRAKIKTPTGALTNAQMKEFEDEIAGKLIRIVKGDHVKDNALDGGTRKKLSEYGSFQEQTKMMENEIRLSINHVLTKQNWQANDTMADIARKARNNNMGWMIDGIATITGQETDEKKAIIDQLTGNLMKGVRGNIELLKIGEQIVTTGSMPTLDKYAEPSRVQVAQQQALNPNHQPTVSPPIPATGPTIVPAPQPPVRASRPEL